MHLTDPAVLHPHLFQLPLLPFPQHPQHLLTEPKPQSRVSAQIHLSYPCLSHYNNQEFTPLLVLKLGIAQIQCYQVGALRQYLSQCVAATDRHWHVRECQMPEISQIRHCFNQFQEHMVGYREFVKLQALERVVLRQDLNETAETQVVEKGVVIQRQAG